MDAFFSMLSSVALFVALALPGYIFVKCKFLRSEQSSVLSTLLTYVGLPFLVLSSTLDIELNGEFVKNALLVSGVCLLFILLVFFASKPLTAGIKEGDKRGMTRFCMTFANNGFLGIPLARAVFGEGGALTYLIVMNILDSVARYTAGVYLISGDRKMISPVKVLLSPALIAFALGIILNLAGICDVIPQVKTYSDYFSSMVTPLCMTILGMKLGGVKLLDLFKNKRTYYVAAIKLVVVPVAAALLFWGASALFDMGTEPVFAALITFGTPTAALSSAFADQFGGDMEGAVTNTLATTVLCVVTIPVLYMLLNLIL